MEVNKNFETSAFFSGGAGMFIQYHDIVKPAYLYAILQMLLTKQTFGLPIHILDRMSVSSIIEWYVHRRFKNPLKQLDYANRIPVSDLDKLMTRILNNDPSIYKISPALNIKKMMHVYRAQHMVFPIYVYSEEEEPYILTDCKEVFQGIKVKYLFGDLSNAIQQCDQNFTYIFSDVELVNRASEILLGSYSHVLLARDYRYNYNDNYKTLKYDIKEIGDTHPFLRMGTTLAMNPKEVANAYVRLLIQEDEIL